MRKETASASGLQHSSRALERGRIPSRLLANIRSMGKINNGLLFHKLQVFQGLPRRDEIRGRLPLKIAVQLIRLRAEQDDLTGGEGG